MQATVHKRPLSIDYPETLLDIDRPAPAAGATNLIGRVNYHVHAPQRQAFHIDPDGSVGKLVSPRLAPTRVAVRDVRSGEATTSFAQDGIGFARLTTRVTAFDDDGGWRSAYDRELTAFLSRELDAQQVMVFDHTVRVDDPDAERRPARNVHGDYSPEGAQRRLVDLLGAKQAAEWAQDRYAFINVWRPIGAAVRSAPLGFVRPASVAPEDWVLIDLKYPDRTGHIVGLVANPQHEWVYQSAMTPDEIVFFSTYDSNGRPPVAHSAIDIVADQPVHRIRKSIESRTLVRY